MFFDLDRLLLEKDFASFDAMAATMATMPNSNSSLFGSVMCVSSRLKPLVLSNPNRLSIFHRSL